MGVKVARRGGGCRCRWQAGAGRKGEEGKDGKESLSIHVLLGTMFDVLGDSILDQLGMI